jgi:hypothetical protein
MMAAVDFFQQHSICTIVLILFANHSRKSATSIYSTFQLYAVGYSTFQLYAVGYW